MFGECRMSSLALHPVIYALLRRQWFVNPPRLQSVRGLSHFHVFARDKNKDRS